MSAIESCFFCWKSQDTFGVPSSVDQHITFHTTGEEASRLYVKKTIVVGNVSKYSTIMSCFVIVCCLDQAC